MARKQNPLGISWFWWLAAGAGAYYFYVHKPKQDLWQDVCLHWTDDTKTKRVRDVQNHATRESAEEQARMCQRVHGKRWIGNFIVEPGKKHYPEGSRPY